MKVDVWEYVDRHRTLTVGGRTDGVAWRVTSSVVTHGSYKASVPGRPSLLARAIRALLPSAGHRWEAVGIEVLYGDARMTTPPWTLWRCPRCEAEVLSYRWPWYGWVPCDEELARSVLES